MEAFFFQLRVFPKLETPNPTPKHLSLFANLGRPFLDLLPPLKPSSPTSLLRTVQNVAGFRGITRCRVNSKFQFCTFLKRKRQNHQHNSTKHLTRLKEKDETRVRRGNKVQNFGQHRYRPHRDRIHRGPLPPRRGPLHFFEDRTHFLKGTHQDRRHQPLFQDGPRRGPLLPRPPPPGPLQREQSRFSQNRSQLSRDTLRHVGRSA